MPLVCSYNVVGSTTELLAPRAACSVRHFSTHRHMVVQTLFRDPIRSGGSYKHHVNIPTWPPQHTTPYHTRRTEFFTLNQGCDPQRYCAVSQSWSLWLFLWLLLDPKCCATRLELLKIASQSYPLSLQHYIQRYRRLVDFEKSDKLSYSKVYSIFGPKICQPCMQYKGIILTGTTVAPQRAPAYKNRMRTARRFTGLGRKWAPRGAFFCRSYKSADGKLCFALISYLVLRATGVAHLSEYCLAFLSYIDADSLSSAFHSI
jgi:hypothetical protein